MAEITDKEISAESEAVVVGTLLEKPALWDYVAARVDKNHFVSEPSASVYRSMQRLRQANLASDVPAVVQDLASVGQLEDIGGSEAVARLSWQAVSLERLEKHLRIVRETHARRQLRVLATRTIAQTLESFTKQSTESIINELQKNLAQLQVDRHDTLHTLHDLMFKTLDEIDARSRGEALESALSSGYPDLDRVLDGGLRPGELIILAARPSMGKTSLAMNIVEHAIMADKAVGVFSMEMSAQQLALRMTASLARIDAGKIRRGDLSDDQWATLAVINEALLNKRMCIDEMAGASLAHLRSQSMQIRSLLGGLDLIVVDYLQLMVPEDRSENRVQEISAISRGLKLLAREMNVPVLALSQLNRSVETRQDKRPVMSDLRDSGSIEQDADVVMMLYRDVYYTKEACKQPNLAELIIAKNRNGPCTTVKLFFRQDLTRFESWADM